LQCGREPPIAMALGLRYTGVATSPTRIGRGDRRPVEIGRTRRGMRSREGPRAFVSGLMSCPREIEQLPDRGAPFLRALEDRMPAERSRNVRRPQAVDIQAVRS